MNKQKSAREILDTVIGILQQSDEPGNRVDYFNLLLTQVRESPLPTSEVELREQMVAERILRLLGEAYVFATGDLSEGVLVGYFCTWHELRGVLRILIDNTVIPQLTILDQLSNLYDGADRHIERDSCHVKFEEIMLRKGQKIVHKPIL